MYGIMELWLYALPIGFFPSIFTAAAANQVFQYFDHIDIHRTRFHAPAAARAGGWSILLRKVIELAENPVAKALFFGWPRVMPTCDQPVAFARTTIPTTDTFKGLVIVGCR